MENNVKRPTVNISMIERAGRIAVGVVGAVAGMLLLVSAGEGTTAVILELLLVAAGLDLIITGATGHCPLYSRLGHVPPSLRDRS